MVARRANLTASKLALRETQICRRIREAREIASVTQSGLAELVGIPRDRLSTYEKGRAPLKCDLALRICRQLIINEEWFATGETKILDQIARDKLIGSTGNLTKMRREIFPRQCVDLLTEPVLHAIAPGALFSAAFDGPLNPIYKVLAAQFFYYPRIAFADANEEPKLAARLVEVVFKRQLTLIKQLAGVADVQSWPMQRQFTRAIFELSTKAFQELTSHNFDIPGFQEFVRAVTNAQRQQRRAAGNKRVDVVSA